MTLSTSLSIPSTVLKLEPLYFSKVWGGNYFSPRIGEVWILSQLKESINQIAGTQTNLSEMLNLFPDYFGGLKRIPFLLKWIDTEDYLSVQVHPNQYQAKLLTQNPLDTEEAEGKDECWLILKCEADSGIYLGLKDEKDEDKFKLALENNEAVDKFLQFYPVKRGDFFYVPAGTIHAIGKNITLLEIQKPSGITYRMWDWNRTDCDGKLRELHKLEALSVANFQIYGEKHLNIFENDLWPKTLLEHDDFVVKIHFLKKGEILDIKTSPKIFKTMICFSGKTSIKIDRNRLVDILFEHETILIGCRQSEYEQTIAFCAEKDSLLVLVSPPLSH